MNELWNGEFPGGMCKYFILPKKWGPGQCELVPRTCRASSTGCIDAVIDLKVSKYLKRKNIKTLPYCKTREEIKKFTNTLANRKYQK